MTIKNNRFAILPHTCSRCGRAFWLEPYKHYKTKRWSFAGCVTFITNLCTDCGESIDEAESEKVK
jgi:ribosomal protein S27AE